MVRCKECYNEFLKEMLVYPVRGYPYCKQCFRSQSLRQKGRFKPLYKKDLEFIDNSINNGQEAVKHIMVILKKQSDKLLKVIK